MDRDHNLLPLPLSLFSPCGARWLRLYAHYGGRLLGRKTIETRNTSGGAAAAAAAAAAVARWMLDDYKRGCTTLPSTETVFCVVCARPLAVGQHIRFVWG